jgi:hypothetical protein
MTDHTRYLENKNPVPETNTLTFVDEGHTYTAKNQYYAQSVEFSTKSSSPIQIISTTTILKYFWPNKFDTLARRLWHNEKNQQRMATDPTYRYYGCESLADIKTNWAQGAILGTEMHEHFEKMCNLIEYDKDNGVPPDDLESKYWLYQLDYSTYMEKRYFSEFVQLYKLGLPGSRFSIYRTELIVYHDVLMISGAIDCLMYDRSTDTYAIVDWKRCKGGIKKNPLNPRKPISELSANSRGHGLPAFEKLRDINLNHYGCQLSVYRNIFEHMTGKTISAMMLVVVDSELIGQPDALHITHIGLDTYSECVSQLFQFRAEELLTKDKDYLSDTHAQKLKMTQTVPKKREALDKQRRLASKRAKQEKQESSSDIDSDVAGTETEVQRKEQRKQREALAKKRSLSKKSAKKKEQESSSDIDSDVVEVVRPDKQRKKRTQEKEHDSSSDIGSDVVEVSRPVMLDKQQKMRTKQQTLSTNFVVQKKKRVKVRQTKEKPKQLSDDEIVEDSETEAQVEQRELYEQQHNLTLLFAKQKKKRVEARRVKAEEEESLSGDEYGGGVETEAEAIQREAFKKQRRTTAQRKANLIESRREEFEKRQRERLTLSLKKKRSKAIQEEESHTSSDDGAFFELEKSETEAAQHEAFKKQQRITAQRKANLIESRKQRQRTIEESHTSSDDGDFFELEK